MLWSSLRAWQSFLATRWKHASKNCKDDPLALLLAQILMILLKTNWSGSRPWTHGERWTLRKTRRMTNSFVTEVPYLNCQAGASLAKLGKFLVSHVWRTCSSSWSKLKPLECNIALTCFPHVCRHRLPQTHCFLPKFSLACSSSTICELEWLQYINTCWAPRCQIESF